MQEICFYSKEDAFKIVDDLIEKGYKFNGVLDMLKEDIEKHVPTNEEEYSSINVRYIGFDEEDKTFNSFFRFLRVSKKELAQALKMENVFEEQRKSLKK